MISQNNIEKAIDAVHQTVQGRTIVMATLHGSSLYGTSTGQSDLDIRVVFMPSHEEILLGKNDFSIDNNPSKRKLGEDDIDVSGFSFARFLKLLGKFDVNAVEMLYASQPGTQGLLMSDESVMSEIRAKASVLVGMESSSPIGHARAIVGAMAPDQESYVASYEHVMMLIKNGIKAYGEQAKLHQVPGLLDGVRSLPMAKYRVHGPKDMVVSEEDIPAEVIAQGYWPGHTLFVVFSDKMMATTMNLGEANAIVAKPLKRMRGEQETRRARMEGAAINTKDLYHAVRILRQYVEIQATGRLVFPRPDAAQLRDIRTGDLTGDALQSVIDEAFNAALDAQSKPMPFALMADSAVREAMIVSHHYKEILKK